MTALPDPHMAPILKRMRAAPAIDYRALPMADGRRIFEDLAAAWHEPRLAIPHIADVSIPGPAGPIRGRLYHPAGEDPRPLTIYLHGGGWAFGSIDSHDRIMRQLARDSDCAVLGIDYRLVPENPFPKPVEDVAAAIRFVRGGSLGPSVEHERIALAGDSAGANLALVAMIQMRDAGDPQVATALLFYGCYAPIFDTDSHRRFGDGSFGLSTEGMRWYWTTYLGREPDSAHGPAAPLLGDLSDLPGLYLNAAGLDPLLDDTLLLSQRLAAAGVGHRLDVVPGVIHGFLRMGRELPAANTALHAAGRYLADALSTRD